MRLIRLSAVACSRSGPAAGSDNASIRGVPAHPQSLKGMLTGIFRPSLIPMMSFLFPKGCLWLGNKRCVRGEDF